MVNAHSPEPSGKPFAESRIPFKEDQAVEGRFAGVDITKSFIEVVVRPTGELWTSTANEDGMTETTDKLRYIRPELVVMEANGTFELPVAGALATEGLPFALVHPRTVRDFARAIGRMSRTDKGQAGLLAYFAELVRPEARSLNPEVIQQLKDLRLRRHDITQMVSLERSRLSGSDPVVLKDLQAHIGFLERSLSMLDEQVNRIIRSSSVWR
jgi:transposase